MRPLMERETNFRCPSVNFINGMSARAVRIDDLASQLSWTQQRPVIDRTGLTGEFDVDLYFQAELAATGPGAAGAAPSIFSAVQDQLGLKLDPVRAPLEVLVIDSVTSPAEQ